MARRPTYAWQDAHGVVHRIEVIEVLSLHLIPSCRAAEHITDRGHIHAPACCVLDETAAAQARSTKATLPLSCLTCIDIERRVACAVNM